MNTMASDPQTTTRGPLYNDQSGSARQQQGSRSHGIPSSDGYDDGGEHTPDDERSIAGQSDFEDEDDHEAQNRTSRLTPLEIAERRPQARKQSPLEDSEFDDTRRETPTHHPPDDACQRQTYDMEDALPNEVVGSYKDSRRGDIESISASNRRSMPSQDRADMSNASQRRDRGPRGRSGERRQSLHRPRSKKAEGRKDRLGGVDRAPVPPSSYRRPRGVSPGDSQEVQADSRRPSASRKKADERGQTRSTSEEAQRQQRRTRSHSSRHSRRRNDEERAKGSRAPLDPDSQLYEHAPVTWTRRQRRNLWGMFGRGLIPPWKIIAMCLVVGAIVCATALVTLGASGAFKKESLMAGEPYVPSQT